LAAGSTLHTSTGNDVAVELIGNRHKQFNLLPRKKGSAMRSFVASLIRDQRGEDLIEYALVAGLISILCTVARNAMASGVTHVK
jgi:Flp pilus assembly pilin Flp